MLFNHYTDFYLRKITHICYCARTNRLHRYIT